MKVLLWGLLLLSVSSFSSLSAQPKSIDKKAFFNDSTILDATIITRLDRLLGSHYKKGYDISGQFVANFPDGITVNDPVVLELRGNFRKDFCYIPPIRLRFNNQDRSFLYSLKSLKLVSECKTSEDFEQYLLKEYLIYRIYNLLTTRSFRTKLLKLTLQDSAGKKKSVTEYAFLLEDIKDIAKREGCKEYKTADVDAGGFDRRQMTLVSVFEYMIGNTDWAFKANHNVKLMIPEKDTVNKVLVIPYDFDYSGLVNTFYAVPDKTLDLQNVRERQYLGYPANPGELEETLKIFRLKKKDIYDLISHFDLLTPKNRKEMTAYLDEFYEMISHPDLVHFNFINNAIVQ